ncbi:MAG: 3-phosphoshikimate 1-carboxyvinyltransferase [Solirubrobacteraceae bacterium]
MRFDPVQRLRGSIEAPPDKSISHRAALLGAMCSEPVRIVNFLEAEDTSSTLRVVRELGALVEVRADDLLVRGTGLREARETNAPLDVGNAGTLMRLLPGWLASQEGRRWTLDGDDSIRARPVDRIIRPLQMMGAGVEASEGRFPPFTVNGSRLNAIEYELPVASAQVKSCLMLAALAADGTTTVIEREPARDHTERMLLSAGVVVERDGAVVAVQNSDELELESIVVPSDASSAAYFIAAGILVPRSRIVLRAVGVNWTRCGFIQVARRMGAIVIGEIEPPYAPLSAHEPVSDLDVAAGPLVGTLVQGAEVPLAIDELPLVALLGCFAEGETIVRGAQELRVKESDRIETVVHGLRGLGAEIEATPDGFVVTGTGSLRGGTLSSHGDHRLALLGAVAGLASEEGVEVQGMEAAAVSYPGFAGDLQTLLGP